MIWMLFPEAQQQFGSHWKDTTHPEKTFAARQHKQKLFHLLYFCFSFFMKGAVQRLCSCVHLHSLCGAEGKRQRDPTLCFLMKRFPSGAESVPPLPFFFFLRGAQFNLGHQTRRQEEWSWHKKVPGSLVAVHLWSQKTTRVGAKRRPYTIDYLTTCKPITKAIMTQYKRTYFWHWKNSREWTQTDRYRRRYHMLNF